MKILLTGGTSLIGGQLAQALAGRGDEVTVLQRRPAHLGLTETLADLGDVKAVRRAVSGQDAVVHLAAKANVHGDPAEYERINVGGTRTVVRAAEEAGVRRLVYVSSPSVAHSGNSLVGARAAPADPRRARGPYARTKAAAELIALAADSPNLSVLAIRPHLVWGPGDTQLAGRIVARAEAGRLPIIGSGAALIDTTYITNAVEALVAAVDRCPQAHGQALVVSNGEPRPIVEILSAICRAGGAEPPNRHLPVGAAIAVGAVSDGIAAARRWLTARSPVPLGEAGDPAMTRFLAEQLSTAHWFDLRQTASALNWSPRISLDEGFRKLAEASISP